MTIPVVVGSLAGQIPVIAIAGITVKYKELTNYKRLRFPVFLIIDEVIE